MFPSLNLKAFGLLPLVAASLFFSACEPKPFLSPHWLAYRKAFLAADGRVVDTGNNGISHSEGQGYGMLLAQYAGDQRSFEQLWHWTKNNLQIRGDHLFAWQYVPEKGIGDRNNATDGDILIAWALLKAGQRWENNEYLSASREIIADIRKILVRVWQGKMILLPGERGFEEGSCFIVNLSYWIYPALAAFQEIDSSPVWKELIDDGLELQKIARFGIFQLPPDWFALKEKPMLSIKFPQKFGYDAIRVPLYMYWYGTLPADEAERYTEYVDSALKQKGFLPTGIRLTDDTFANSQASHGVKTVFSLLRARAAGKKFLPGHLPDNMDDYYSATLTLLVRVAALGEL
jgi:endo-1,4-beta-D-glucanase Y